jgi:phospholipid-binding lipoprotein MlaA
MRRAVLALLALPILLGGCATMPRDPAARAAFEANNDPLEPLNRRIFAFNLLVDRAVLRPIAQIYVRVVPGPGRDALRNFIKNLQEPIVFANDVLQGGFTRAGKTVLRFAIDSTAGFAGIVDVGARNGLERQSGAFGQTLHVWGFGEGPYLVLPIVGPSNPRDGIGEGVDIYLDPFRYVAKHNNYPTGYSVAEQGAEGIDERSRNIDTLDELQRESVDYYASLRSLFRQNRAGELRRGRQAQAPPPADFYNDPGSGS